MRVSAPRRFSVLAMVAATTLVAVTFAFAAPTFARESAADLTKRGLTNTATTAGLETAADKASLPVIIGNIIYAALSLTGIIFVLLTIYGGFIWMQARGNQEDVAKAKKIIESAIIGVVVIGLAFAITNFVIDRITEAQGSTPVEPAAP
ncbi:hypothetical protein HY635_02450 [Candidatus Uhrbacteria bacterium]|nr:hypothetical protein [Candidatus Uhrbacteria bacterium]